ncbi:uncharacterized protein LOC119741708 isoform X2 [Patiria miniata]|uniref:Uncharacterized protein n=1 Tax=Patiria miniata TaxID=46514 RepID=A0A914BBU0_PATMI|nr:uncharacterized protein LOC119741708 isoform X2 [Patiria miniata]
MGAIKEFIKEHSPASETPKKKRRVRLKNFNPFRKRKYKVLDENNPDLDECYPRDAKSSLADDQPNSSSEQVNSSGPRELLQAAWGSLGLAKGNPNDPDSGKRKTARRQGAYECLVEEETPVDETTTDAAGETVQDLTGSLSESDDEERCDEKGASEVKRVVISDDIKVIETEEQAPPQKKKKKSAKKKIKKAGIKTAKYLGHGFANMALTFQYMTPEAAMAPVAKEIAQRREERYREMCSLAYTLAT